MAQHSNLLSWQQAMRDCVRDLDTLCSLLQLDRQQLPPLDDVSSAFPLRVPRSYIAAMRVGDPNDPLLRQVLPLQAEQQVMPGYGHDPLEEAAARPVPGVLHKYRSRVLVMPTGACAVHCRYCFRRHFPYQSHGLLAQHWPKILQYIRSQAAVNEVIFSGGDPLLLPDDKLAAYCHDLTEISTIRRLRFHTRIPIVLPERITPELAATFAAAQRPVIMMLHCNHAQALTPRVEAALHLLQSAGVRLYNQAVLLAGVNDSVAAQVDLSERLFECGVQPYYVHALDPVAGTAHFDINTNQAQSLMQAVREALPGWLMPTFVREVPGEMSKTPIV